MIFVVGGAIAFFFEFLLLGKKNKSLADKILAFMMFFQGLHLFFFYFQYSGLDFEYPHLLGVAVPFPLIHSPLLYLYVAALTGKLKKWNNIHLLHFFPVFLFYIYYIKFFISSGDYKIEFVEGVTSGEIKLLFLYHYISLITIAITYLILTIILYKKHQKTIKNYFSFESEKINLHWLRNLIIGMAAIWLVVIATVFLNESIDIAAAIYVTLALFVISIGYFGIKQGNIFVTQPSISSNKDLNAETGQNRYVKSGLKGDDIPEIQQKLSLLMEKEKIFLEEKLSLPKVAEKLDIHPNYLSQVINERFNKNFYDFVNHYRVEEFKKLVKQPKNKNLTLFSLALDSGFASKAAFNSAFKKLTGQTPSEYLKSYS